MVRVQGLHERLEVTGADDFVLHVHRMAHHSQYSGAEDLQAVVRAVAPPHPRRALLARADNPLVHGDAVMQHRHNLPGVYVEKNFQRRPVDTHAPHPVDTTGSTPFPCVRRLVLPPVTVPARVRLRVGMGDSHAGSASAQGRYPAQAAGLSPLERLLRVLLVSRKFLPSSFVPPVKPGVLIGMTLTPSRAVGRRGLVPVFPPGRGSRFRVRNTPDTSTGRSSASRPRRGGGEGGKVGGEGSGRGGDFRAFGHGARLVVAVHDAHVDDAVEDAEGSEVHGLLAFQQLEGAAQQFGQLQEDAVLGLQRGRRLQLFVARLEKKKKEEKICTSVLQGAKTRVHWTKSLCHD